MKRGPALARLVVLLLVGGSMAQRILDDLDDEWWEFVCPARGPVRAWLWYMGMAVRSVGAVWRAALLRRVGGGRAWEPAEGRSGAGVLEWTMDLMRDLKLAVRTLARSPGLSVSATSVMALGIAAAAIVFSVADRVLIRPMPYLEPDRVVAVHGIRADEPGNRSNVSYPNMADVRSRSRTLQGMAAGASWRPAFTEARRTQVIQGLTVSWDYFSVLGVEPAAGRFFTREEEGEGRPRVAVLSHSLWQERYGRDPDVVGRSVSINAVSYQIVGVAPPDFEDPIGAGYRWPVQIWRTPWFEAAEWFRSGRSWRAVGRLDSTASVETANEEIGALMADLASQWPEENAGRSMRATPMKQWVTSDSRTTLGVLGASVVLILLIACANVANLLLARGLRRADETSVRVALGASAGRLLRAALVEAVTLSLLGGAIGIALAFVGLDLVRLVAGDSIPRLADASIDQRVLIFSAATAVLTGLFFGILPALREGGAAGASRTVTAERRATRLRRSLVVSEVALTVVLMFGAGLFLRTVAALYDVDLGIETENVLVVPLHDAGWAEQDVQTAEAQWDQILQGVKSIPDVRGAGAIDIVPLADNYSCDGTSRADMPAPAPGEGQCTEVRVLLPGVLDALGIPVLAGRSPLASDRASAEPVVWISDATRRLFWPDGSNPVGGRLAVHGGEFAVAGVVGDVRHYGPGEAPRPMLFVPASQEPWNGPARGLDLVVLATGSPEAVAAAVREEVAGVNPRIPVGRVTTGEELLAQNVTAPRFRLSLAGAFAAVALLIAMVGLAGVLSFSVSRRKREIGVRLALGARATDIRAMVVGEGLALLGWGLILGLAVALPASLGLSRFLFAVRPWDPVTVVAVAVVVLAGLLASAYPAAAQAARASPASVLDAE